MDSNSSHVKPPSLNYFGQGLPAGRTARTKRNGGNAKEKRAAARLRGCAPVGSKIP